MDSENCWAKTTDNGQPGISVRDHFLNVGCVAEAIIAALTDAVRALPKISLSEIRLSVSDHALVGVWPKTRVFWVGVTNCGGRAA